MLQKCGKDNTITSTQAVVAVGQTASCGTRDRDKLRHCYFVTIQGYLKTQIVTDCV